jgi:hypothetical protein
MNETYSNLSAYYNELFYKPILSEKRRDYRCSLDHQSISKDKLDFKEVNRVEFEVPTFKKSSLLDRRSTENCQTTGMSNSE